MRKRVFYLTLVAAVILQGGRALSADAPDPDTILHNMKLALEPDRPSLRKLTFTVSAPPGEPSENARRLVAGQAMKKVPDAKRMLIVMRSPDDAKGVAFLADRVAKGEEQIFVYLPMVRRVRRVLPIGAYEPFLSTDFFLGDLAYVSLQAERKLLGTEQHNGVSCYKVQETPKQQWYYGKVVSWIATEGFLPVERDFYSPANQLWKTEKFENVETVQGVPVVKRMRMDDVQQKTSTVIDVSDVHFDAEMPDGLVDPANLREAASSPAWNGIPAQ